jgi:polyvinyl alcohol dehydrogenase (cytochrome)
MNTRPRRPFALAAALLITAAFAVPIARAQNAPPPTATQAAPPAPTATQIPADELPNSCGAKTTAVDSIFEWTGWGNGPSNWRYQSPEQAQIWRSGLPRLQLQWAFGIANVRSVRSQPAIFAERNRNGWANRVLILVGGLDGTVYALDAASGCTFWATKAKPVRSGLVVAHNIRVGAGQYVDPVFYGDASGGVDALDVHTGKFLWRTQADDHPNATITGTPAWWDGRLYVPVSSGEEGARRRPEYECCTFRGSVVALDAATGKKTWQSYMDPRTPAVVGKTPEGRNIYAPSGMAIWSAPTIDAEHNRIYVGTGDNYSDPPTKTSDAVVALDMDTGKILWSVQFHKDDVYKIDCGDPPREGCSPPTNPEFDLGASPILVDLDHKKRVLILGQKSGLVYAVDPDADGKLLWHQRAGVGGLLGGVQWGPATDGTNVYVAVSDLAFQGRSPDPTKGGGIVAYRVSDGAQTWKTPPPGCGDRRPCSPAQSQAVTAIPGAVFSGSIDGHLRAYDTRDGKIIWDFDTARDFDTVDKVPAHGGSLDVGGPIVAGGMVFVMSGYPGFGAMPGNILLAFAAK